MNFVYQYQRSTPTCIIEDLISARSFSQDTKTERNDQRTRQPASSFQTGFGLIRDQKKLVQKKFRDTGNEIHWEARNERQILSWVYEKNNHDFSWQNIFQIDQENLSQSA